ncbi:hypothetical protein HOLleu_41760 [Holothuria leucospilota]|uniref:Uncharacterized protein n=1 Tax=Holothuria leucospilota TaxID=206669 RepID=A0A9Q0YGE2_HOLLE|nr:hypothetical protein HOLleu_41760 [Holothuria leucospilota]
MGMMGGGRGREGVLNAAMNMAVCLATVLSKIQQKQGKRENICPLPVTRGS